MEVSGLDPDAELNPARAPLGARPRFFDDPVNDHLMSMVMALGTELAVTRERLDTVERLLEKAGVLTQGGIDDFRPDPAAATARATLHQDFLRRFLRSIVQERERLERGDHAQEPTAGAADGHE